MSGQDCVLGLDLGTGSLKATLLGADGQIVAAAAREYPTRTPQPGWAEQNPQDWVTALQGALTELWQTAKGRCQPAAVRAVGVTAAAHIPVLLDADDQPLRAAILWHDQRSRAQVESLAREPDLGIADRTANLPGCCWTLPQLCWVQENEPEILPRVRRFLTSKDYLNYLLTGVCACDDGSAAATMLSSVRERQWNAGLTARCGLPAAALPPIVGALEEIGTVSAAGAALSGLPPGTPVIGGMLDSAAELLSAGAVAPGDGVVRLGTAGGILLVVPQLQQAEGLITYPHPAGGAYRQAGTNCCALAVRWLRELLRDEAGPELSWSRLDDLVCACPAGADGLLFHPYLQGERSPYWDPCLRGSFTGQTMTHGRAEHARAVMEGTAFSLRDCWQSFGASTPAAWALVGGGARSRVWPQIIADILDTPLRRVEPGDSTHGVALAAGVSAGFWRDLSCAAATTSLPAGAQSPITPNPTHADLYRNRFGQYRMVQQALAAVYRAACAS